MAVPRADIQIPSVVSLHRYFIAANRMKEHFERAFTDESLLKRAPANDPLMFSFWIHSDDLGIFMYYWYSALYVVIEGYQELRLSDPQVEARLDSTKIDALRLLRNGTFHFQKEYYSPKIVSFLSSRDAVRWVRAVHDALGSFLLAEMKKLKPNKAVDPTPGSAPRNSGASSED